MRRDTSIRLVVSEGAAVRQGLSAATINRILVAVDAFYRWAIFTGAFSGANPIAMKQDQTSWRVSDRHRPFLTGILRQRPEVRELRLKTMQRLPRPMNQQQVEGLLAATRNLRDRSLVLLMLNGGLRPGEVLGLHLADIGYGRRRIFVRCRDDHPKGARSKSRVERVVDLHDGETLETLNTYVMHERPGDADVPFVFLVGGTGVNRQEPLSYSALARLFARACTSHRFRHTVGTQLAERGAKLHTIMSVLGHQTPHMSMVYARISDAEVLRDYRSVLGPGEMIAGPGAEAIRAGKLSCAAIDWLKSNFIKTELELGHCLRLPSEGPCECDLYLSCAKFVTTKAYAGRLQERRKLESVLAEDARERGWSKEVERHQSTASRIERLLKDLGEAVDQ